MPDSSKRTHGDFDHARTLLRHRRTGLTRGWTGSVPSYSPIAGFSQRKCHMRILKKRSPSLTATTLHALAEHPLASAVVATAGLMAAAAIVNRRLADKAQRDNPPQGRFIDIDGVRLHYVERGSGRPLVLFHGNGSMIQDFESSGLIDLAAKDYRVIVFDRPGFGHSLRPRNVVWTLRPRPTSSRKLLRILASKRRSCSDIPGARRLRSPWQADIPQWSRP